MLHGDDGNARRRQPRQVTEQRTALHKAFDAVAHQVGPRAFHQVDKGQLVLQRDLLHSQDFLQSHGLNRSGFNAGVTGHHHAARAAHKTNAGHHATARNGLLGVFLVLQIAGQ